MDRYHAILAEWLNTPWALRREVLQAHVRVLAAKLAGGAPAYRAMEDEGPINGGERISAFEARRRDVQAMAGNGGGIAVLPLHGTIVQRAGMMTEWCGGTSTQQFGAALDAGVAGVDAVLDAPSDDFDAAFVSDGAAVAAELLDLLLELLELLQQAL
mgnify:CR=1 FL=1